jgi:tRNA(Ile)-lysidine synthetase-like protein
MLYWFGQYTPAEAQKKLWMINAQATEYRQRIDADIYHQFAHLLGCWEQWIAHPQYFGIQGKVASIILLDQFGRHIHRFLKEQQHSYQSDTLNSIPMQTNLDQAALSISQSIVTHHAAELSLLAPAVQIFTYMPFRHANRLETVQQVQAAIQHWTDLHQQHADLLSRFRKATHRRLAVLQDEARRNGTTREAKNDHTQMSSQLVFTQEDILAALPFEVEDMKPATQHIVYQTILKFLQSHGIGSERNGVQDGKKYPVVVSLSGGVDSMVISAVLAHLSRENTLPIRVVAVHIDYANRPESAAEAEFCRTWCATYDIDFDVRRIDHVTRGVTARDEYERISRQVRYDFYRCTIKRVGTTGGEDCGILLGHHRGDLRENVLSNAHKGSGPLDLSGMTVVSRNDGVTLYRPLLPLEKTAIFDYAHTFGVPYFKDTTPHWSTRGKLRNRLLPLLEEIYGEGCLHNLSNLAVESDECRALFQKMMFDPFMDKIQREPMGMILSTAPWKDQSLFFWKFVLRETLHSGGLGMFSDKAVLSFLERLHAGRAGWLQCRKDYAVYLQEDGLVFVWKPDSFPWRKSDQYEIEGRTIDYGTENTVTVGPWRVTALLIDPRTINNDDSGPLLQAKAIESMAHLMKGSVEYFLQVPTWPQQHSEEHSNGTVFVARPLVFRKFTKASRPVAWKSTDTRLQDTLPVVGNDDTSLAALQDPIAAGAAYTDQTSGCTVPTPVRLVKVSICLEKKLEQNADRCRSLESGCIDFKTS